MRNREKILMTLMGMEIGGAETHVLELCKALTKKGMQVYVASNGGAYEPDLEACGIVHYKVPLHNKRIDNMINAYHALKRIIIENDIQLVHAHARIPGFLCGLLQQKLSFHYVTTAHWVFSTEFPFNILSNWGEKSLAVSEDIKRYLIDNYRVPAENIYITINGIDTEKFAPNLTIEALQQEFAMDMHRTRIVSLSRLDKDRSLAAHLLIQSVPALYRACPALMIYIVGGGDDYETVRREAEAMNRKIGEPVIRLTGGRVDSNLWMAAADIFIGASRAVLEAMSAARPIVAIGNEGYLGRLTEANLADAMRTNFCYRGCGEATAEKLTTDLLSLLAEPPEDRAAMGQALRMFVQDNYSVERMANDALALYERVRPLPLPAKARKHYKTDVMISGYYGYNNSGDDILLQSMLDDLRSAQPDIRITVLSMRPRETLARYGVSALYRFNLPAIWWRLRKTRMLITGGGSLIQDKTSTQSLIYYLWVIHTAYKQGIKNMLYANGIGPVYKPGNIRRVQRILNQVDLITLRDAESWQILRNIGVDKPKTYVTADAAFSLRPADENATRQFAKNMLGIHGPFFCVAIREWKYNPPGLEAQIARFVDYTIETYGYQALFVTMRPTEDTEISKRVMALMHHPAELLRFPNTVGQEDPHIIRGLASISAFVLGMRFHALIYAVNQGVPVIGLVYDPKIQHFMDTVQQPYYMPIESVNADTLIQFVDEIHTRKTIISTIIREAAEIERQKAARNAALCIELLQK